MQPQKSVYISGFESEIHLIETIRKLKNGGKKCQENCKEGCMFLSEDEGFEPPIFPNAKIVLSQTSSEG